MIGMCKEYMKDKDEQHYTVKKARRVEHVLK